MVAPAGTSSPCRSPASGVTRAAVNRWDVARKEVVTTHSSSMSAAEITRARERFRVDQEHAEYVEYVEAWSRISRTWYWRRTLRRFLREHGYGSTISGPVWEEHFPG